jgi:hypothetical protein
MLQEGVLGLCKPLLQQPEEMDRRKGLLAISAIVRGYTPAMVEFLKDPQLLASTLTQVCSQQSACSTGAGRCSSRSSECSKHVMICVPDAERHCVYRVPHMPVGSL